MPTTTEPIETTALPLLADPAKYKRCICDLKLDQSQLDYWIALFRSHFPSLIQSWTQQQGNTAEAAAQGETARRHFFAYIDAVEADPSKFEPLDIIAFCIAREEALRHAGIDDAYRETKRQENIAALKLLPALLGELDALPPVPRTEAIVQGIFAGNIFDLGATDTARMFEDGGIDFHSVRGKLKPRPWLIDDFDHWTLRLNSGLDPYQCALLFVDNAGTDIVLGMIPFARDLIQRGTKVILTANSTPSLNDITIDELNGLLALIGAWDTVIADALESEQLITVASGNGLPLIDLAAISTELAAIVERNLVDLVVLEGMGRGVESNLHVDLKCDSMKIAMIKDQGVADVLAGTLYDLVFKFDIVNKIEIADIAKAQ